MSNSRLSRRYAKALFSLGQEDGSFSQYGQELELFSSFCREHEDFGEVISNRIFSVEDRKKILQAVLEKSDFSGIVKNFLKLLLDKERIGAVEAIYNHYGMLMDETLNIAKAEIITAKPLKNEALDKINKSLEELTTKTIRSEVSEDPALIGGVLVKIGDLVLDGSIKAQLEGLKESFKRGE